VKTLAITPGTVDLSFDTANGASDPINALDLQPDGKLLIGGTFTVVGGAARNQFARLNADGSVDASFDPPLGYPGVNPHAVEAVVRQPDGKILVAGTRIWRKPVGLLIRGEGHYLARFTVDGQLDPSFRTLIYTNDFWLHSGINGLAVQRDGKILFSTSQFTDISIFSTETIRLNTDGTLDPSFNALESLGRGSIISCLAPQSDGKFLVGLISGVIRLNQDGSADPAFHPPDLGWVRSIVLQPDGNMLVGGSRLARLLPDGSSDLAFYPEVTLADARVALRADGVIVVASGSTVYLLNSDGALEPSFLPAQLTGQARDIGVQPDGRIVVVGSFNAVNGIPQNNIARIWGAEPDTTIPPSILVAPTNQVALEGEDAAFSVTVRGTPAPAVQWLFNGSALPGATNRILPLTRVALERAGFYQVLASNALGSARSQPVSLSIKPLPIEPGGTDPSPNLRVVNPRRDGSQFTVTVPLMETGKKYSLELTDSVEQQSWTSLDPITGTGVCGFLSDSAATNASRFYRVRVE
jgi:uncharacterized delta-60 repeat protein